MDDVGVGILVQAPSLVESDWGAAVDGLGHVLSHTLPDRLPQAVVGDEYHILIVPDAPAQRDRRILCVPVGIRGGQRRRETVKQGERTRGSAGEATGGHGMAREGEGG